MFPKSSSEIWLNFLSFMEEKCSAAEFQNWLAPIQADTHPSGELLLKVPNIFVQEYLLQNYKRDLLGFIPTRPNGELALHFTVIEETSKPVIPVKEVLPPSHHPILNPLYTFDHFIEGPSNQFVKSAALGVAAHPGKSYNPLFIHGGVGLGKTHLLHAVGHAVAKSHKKLKVHSITTEGFINDIVDNLKKKSMDKMKRFYRSLDILLVDDIQFLQSRLNFEEEFCNTFESLIQQNKQIVITSDKPPSELKLSERMIARMEWGLVAHISIPDLETRVAILQHKADLRGIRLPHSIAMFIAQHIFHNVRQLEGAINRLSAFSRLFNKEVTEEIVEKTLGELFQKNPQKRVSVENILKCVSAIFEVRVSDLKGSGRTKDIALPRQVAMYLAKELMTDSLMKLSSAFGGKTHSTLLHSWKKIREQIEKDDSLRRQVEIARRNLEDKPS
ncbi:chromosomal replication initiator protein DnaA [Rhabdochlamydiaceae symbiont of Dictyostelium giganteum]|uniref:chromosomal replication initiator protein DnaA n=1 Tax=Rhabdochlamydiaceae symbiont of Dictyostelium giganteum TaxID=3342349 RepID=UPI003851600A